jgi:hypothetical protein
VELKRKLTALAKRMNPQIEAYTVAKAIGESIKRIDELMTYAQEKLDRSEERKKNKEETNSKLADDRKKKAAAGQLAQQNAESDANLADQKESFDERNAVMSKSEKPVDAPVAADPE